MEQKRRKIQKKERWKIENGRWKSFKMRRGPLFFFFVCVCFVFCFFVFFAFHFSKLLKFVVGLPKQEFSAWKKHFTPGKKSRKMTLPPLKTIPLMPLLSLYDFLRGWPIIFMPKGGPEFLRWGGGFFGWLQGNRWWTDLLQRIYCWENFWPGQCDCDQLPVPFHQNLF